MITIEQLLESVDLDFEPRWITQDKVGYVCIWENKPERCDDIYHVDAYNVGKVVTCPKLKLAEFKNKHWTKCIYEVPRKTDEYEKNLEKTRPADSDLVYRVKLPIKTTGNIEKLPTSAPFGCQGDWREKINELVNYVNALIESNNIHEKQIDELQMKLEPEKYADF